MQGLTADNTWWIKLNAVLAAADRSLGNITLVLARNLLALGKHLPLLYNMGGSAQAVGVIQR
jgi:hypothetical protein